MHLKDLYNYKPINEQEITDKKAMITFLEKNEDAFLRTNLIAHFTTSGIILNKELSKVLFINHLIYKSWGWTGGHNDGNTDFLEVALKEAKEETGLQNIKALSNKPVSLDNIFVENHFKKGTFVGDHIHMNLTYLLIADENDELKIKVDENSGVRWFTFDEALNSVTEERMKYVYTKIFNQLKKYNKKDI